jgi:formylglycine-generating enzyme required for sulfatase activity
MNFTEQLEPLVLVHLKGRTFSIDRDPVTRASYFAFLERTGHKAPAGVVLHAGSPRDPVVGLSQEDAARYAQFHGMRLPSEAEWAASAAGAASAIGLSDLGLRGLCKVWEWTSTPHKGGFIVRGGRYRDRADLPVSPNNRSWEDAGAADVGFRCVVDGERTVLMR